MLKSLTTWVLLCPYLRDVGGHEAEYVAALVEELHNRGVNVAAVLPLDTLVSLPYGTVSRVFAPEPLAKIEGQLHLRLWRKVFRLAFKTRRALEYVRLFLSGKPGTRFLLHTAGMEEIELAQEAFRLVSFLGDVGRLKVIIRADHHDEISRVRQFSRILGRTVGRVDLYTDTTDLAQALQPIASRPIGVVPIPGLNIANPIRNNREVRFAYFGLRRNSKGFGRLPDLTRHLPLGGEMAGFRILVHATAEVDSSENHDQTEQRLVELGVTFDRRRLTSDAYRDCLLQTEVVLLPYDEMIYRYGSSGVFVDALKAGCTVIVPAGTWMAKEAERCGLRRVFVVDFSNPESVRRTAKEAWDSRCVEVESSEDEKRWESQNSPSGVINALSDDAWSTAVLFALAG